MGFEDKEGQNSTLHQALECEFSRSHFLQRFPSQNNISVDWILLQQWLVAEISGQIYLSLFPHQTDYNSVFFIQHPGQIKPSDNRILSLSPAPFFLCRVSLLADKWPISTEKNES